MVFKLEFEKQDCTRCGGSGEHSFTPRYGTRCFKCNGSTRQLSAAGSRALKAYDALIEERCTKEAREVKDKEEIFFKADGFLFKRSGWYVVEKSYKDENDSTHWVFRFSDGPQGGRSMSVFSNTKVQFRDIEAMKEIMREVAKRFKGATIIES